MWPRAGGRRSSRARRRAGTGEAGRDGGARRRDAIAAGESAHRQRLLQ
ncbi:hypothetical protein BURPS305_6510 [Burkholderia pseudomallei 305]|nr:hypothetical protein BURPS305_6510 [Burkholderia pseudomallei 305]